MPIPRTAAQAEAARRNGSRSRGPVSAEGRARASLNGTRHGLTSGRGVFRLLPGEDPEEWRAHLGALLARHDPADPAERHWVEQIACAAWRQRRLLDLEGRVVAAAVGADDESDTVKVKASGGQPVLPSLATLARYGGRIERDLRLAEAQLLALRRSRPRADGTPALAPLGLAEVRALLARGEEADARALGAARARDTSEPGRPVLSGHPPARPGDLQERDELRGTPRPVGPPLKAGGDQTGRGERDGSPPAEARPLNRQQRRRFAALARKAG